MELTEKEAFRLGFLTRCAEEGLTGSNLQSRIKSAGEKQALVGYILPALALGGGLAALRGGAGELGSSLGTLAGLPIAGGLAAGSALGWGAAKATEPDISEEDIKAQELADTYRIYANRAKANRKAHQYRVSRQHI
jgi:hypothetical protein